MAKVQCSVQTIFSAVREHCPPEKPFAIRFRSTSHHSPVANRCRFWLGRSLALPLFRRLKSALSFCVINYGLKPVAWNFVFASLAHALHATDFSQWLMTSF